jgi:1-aminocyclopropane-1-carboxylate deaminase
VGTTEEEVLETLKSRGKKPYSIPPGASLHPLGGLGYARCAFEILEQEKQLGVSFDVIITASGSGSTLAGLVVGFKLAQKIGLLKSRKRLIGFSIMRKQSEVVELVLSIARTAANLVGLDVNDITSDDFEISDSYLGGAYGLLDIRTTECIKELARTEGVLVDPVYTGKAFTGLLDMARGGQFGRRNVLFCHTGGQVAMSAYPQLK